MGWVAAALLVLAGCSEDPEPIIEPPAETTPASDPSPTGPKPPELPQGAGAKNSEGAEAFVRYWIDLFNYAQATGDTSQLAALSDDRCDSCQTILRSIDKTYRDGGSVDGGELSLGRIRELPPDYGAEWGGFGKGRSAPQVIVTGSGQEERHDGARFSLYAYASWRDGAWIMTWLRTPT